MILYCLGIARTPPLTPLPFRKGGGGVKANTPGCTPGVNNTNHVNTIISGGVRLFFATHRCEKQLI